MNRRLENICRCFSCFDGCLWGTAETLVRRCWCPGRRGQGNPTPEGGRLHEIGTDYLSWVILPFKLPFPLVSLSSHSPCPTSGKLIPAFSSKTDWEPPGNALSVCSCKSGCEPRLLSSVYVGMLRLLGLRAAPGLLEPRSQAGSEAECTSAWQLLFLLLPFTEPLLPMLVLAAFRASVGMELWQ